MKLAEFNAIQMVRTDAAHTGASKISSIGVPSDGILSAAEQGAEKTRKSFDEFLVDAVKSMNSQQLAVSDLQQKLVTEPDSVDIHDVTIAMSKARLSLNLAQSVIDRLVQGWSEITTTR